MKNIKVYLLLLGALVAIGVSVFLVKSNTKVNQASPASLSNEEINGLIQMREEEKLARDVYSVLYSKWNIPAFSNITGSEQVHTSKVKILLDKYNLPDPVQDDSIGVFQSPKMQELYSQLLERGLQSLADALQVGIVIEEMDIKDLDREISQTQNPEITSVYENLRQGSYRHLSAFNSNLEKRTK